MKSNFFKIWDLLIYFFIFSLLILMIIVSNLSSDEELRLYIQTENSKYYYPLYEEKSYLFKGPIGKTIVKCGAKGAKIIDSNCKSKECMRGGWISSNGQWRACLPNKILITVEGGKKKLGEVDEKLY